MRMKPSALLQAAKAMPPLPKAPGAPFTARATGAQAFANAARKQPPNQFQPPDVVQRENPNLSPLQQFVPPTNNPGPTALQRPQPNAMQPKLPGDKIRLVPKGSPL